MTECQGCGAWNESHRTLCVLCGTPLAETDEWDASAELPPLPPLPDGGLAASMPPWLRDVPAAARAAPEQPPESALLGPHAALFTDAEPADADEFEAEKQVSV